MNKMLELNGDKDIELSYYMEGEDKLTDTDKCLVDLVKKGRDEEAMNMAAPLFKSIIVTSAIAYRYRLDAKFENINNETIESIEQVLNSRNSEQEKGEIIKKRGFIQQVRNFIHRRIFPKKDIKTSDQGDSVFSDQEKQELDKADLDIDYAQKFLSDMSFAGLTKKQIIYLLKNQIDTRDRAMQFFKIFYDPKTKYTSDIGLYATLRFLLKNEIDLVLQLCKIFAPSDIAKLLKFEHPQYSLQEILAEAVVYKNIVQDKFDLNWFVYHIKNEAFISNDYSEHHNQMNHAVFVYDLFSSISKWQDGNKYDGQKVS